MEEGNAHKIVKHKKSQKQTMYIKKKKRVSWKSRWKRFEGGRVSWVTLDSSANSRKLFRLSSTREKEELVSCKQKKKSEFKSQFVYLLYHLRKSTKISEPWSPFVFTSWGHCENYTRKSTEKYFVNSLAPWKYYLCVFINTLRIAFSSKRKTCSFWWWILEVFSLSLQLHIG